ncbi:hypothetical protein FOZ62_007308, partial [Perkinsus olseni]
FNLPPSNGIGAVGPHDGYPGLGPFTNFNADTNSTDCYYEDGPFVRERPSLTFTVRDYAVKARAVVCVKTETRDGFIAAWDGSPTLLSYNRNLTVAPPGHWWNFSPDVRPPSNTGLDPFRNLEVAYHHQMETLFSATMGREDSRNNQLVAAYERELAKETSDTVMINTLSMIGEICSAVLQDIK